MTILRPFVWSFLLIKKILTMQHKNERIGGVDLDWRKSHADIDLVVPLTNCNHFTLPAMSRSREHQPDRTRSRASERTAHLCVRRMWVIVYLFN